MLLMDADTGAVLAEKNRDTPSLLASTTKIMTALVVVQRCDLDRRVRIPAEATGIEGCLLYTSGQRSAGRPRVRCGGDPAARP